jgi:hypothetical protein
MFLIFLGRFWLGWWMRSGLGWSSVRRGMFLSPRLVGLWVGVAARLGFRPGSRPFRRTGRFIAVLRSRYVGARFRTCRLVALGRRCAHFWMCRLVALRRPWARFGTGLWTPGFVSTHWLRHCGTRFRDLTLWRCLITGRRRHRTHIAVGYDRPFDYGGGWAAVVL